MSGARKRVSSTAATVEMEVPRSSPTSKVRRIQIECLAPLRRAASNDVDEVATLINMGDPRATRYCFVAPRTGRR